MRLILVWLVIINLSSAPLHNTMIMVDDDAIEVGTIKVGEEVKVEIPKDNSYRVIFTLGQEREEWLGTNKIDFRDTKYKEVDTLKISDESEIFNIEIL